MPKLNLKRVSKHQRKVIALTLLSMRARRHNLGDTNLNPRHLWLATAHELKMQSQYADDAGMLDEMDMLDDAHRAIVRAL